MDRNQLTHLVSKVLELYGPLRARDIARRIGATPGCHEVDRTVVNRILYAGLSQSFDCDAEFRWRLRATDASPGSGVNGENLYESDPNEYTNAGSSPEDLSRALDRGSGQMVSSSSELGWTAPEDLSPRALALKAVQRLRSGLPPAGRIADLTITTRDAEAQTAGLLGETLPGKRLMFAVGEYGNGKSHWLAWLRERAQLAGFATCQLSADSYGSALNHPVRFLPLVLGSLSLPHTNVSGYNDLLYRYVRSLSQSQQLASELSERLAYKRGLVGQILDSAELVRDACRESGGIDSERGRAAIKACCDYVSGQRMRGRTNSIEGRTIAYRLLETAASIVMDCGCAGIILTVDEAESVFTKLAHGAIPGAFRTLSALWGGSSIKNVRTAVAITPDARRRLTQEVAFGGIAVPGVAEEPLIEFCDALAHSRVPMIECAGVEPVKRGELLKRVRATYEVAYPGALPSNGDGEDWMKLASEAQHMDVPLRVLVRLAVDTLDVMRLQ